MTTNGKELPPLPSPSRSSTLGTEARSPTTVITDITNGNEPRCNLLEADYDTAPSVLYRCIEVKNWEAAIKRCRNYPQEASIVISRRDGGGNIRWRQLPLHAAFIFRAKKEVISELVRVYPQGCSFRDDQGMLPLHLAFRYNASESVINLLLKICPEAIRAVDAKGRYPILLVRSPKVERSEKQLSPMKTLTLRTYLSFLVSWSHKGKESSAANFESDENLNCDVSVVSSQGMNNIESVGINEENNLEDAIDKSEVQELKIKSLIMENEEKKNELSALRTQIAMMTEKLNEDKMEHAKNKESQMSLELRLEECQSSKQQIKDTCKKEMEVYQRKLEDMQKCLKTFMLDITKKTERIEELENIVENNEELNIMNQQLATEQSKNVAMSRRIEVFEATEKKLMNRICDLTDKLVKTEIVETRSKREKDSKVI